jgi:putative SOS response-associated peptidase YedK
MCGRFTLTRKRLDELAAELDAEVRPEDVPLYRPRYNIAPTDQHWILREKDERRQLLPATWGLVNSWAEDAKGAAQRINARGESALRRPAFREAFAARRCVVPADGFFEWTGAKEARRPIWFHSPRGELLLFAGLYESWLERAASAWRRTFTILTTEPNDVVRPVHDRMPVILPPERIDEWIYVPPAEHEREAYARRLLTLIAPAGRGVLVATPVSRRVNSVTNDDEACLEPAADGEAAGAPRRLL